MISLTTLLLLLPLAHPSTCEDENNPTTFTINIPSPILLNSTGGFAIGGKILTSPDDANEKLSCGHGYVEYFIPWDLRKTSLVMWHSSSTQHWQNRWDGGEGFKDRFLRSDYAVYLWDGPGVGRANWGCEKTHYTPTYRNRKTFYSWNFGPTNPYDLHGGSVTLAQDHRWWSDSQFPITNEEALNQATRSRYQEFDTDANVELHAQVAAEAADSGKLGHDIVYLTHSGGGLRALMTVTKAIDGNIKGVVLYETSGVVLPDNVNVTTALGQYFVSPEAFKKLAKLEAIQFVWGDHRVGLGNSQYNQSIAASYVMADLINQAGGNAEVIILPDQPDVGKGNTHVPFADMNNEKVAVLLDKFLQRNGLDTYLRKGPTMWWVVNDQDEEEVP